MDLEEKIIKENEEIIKFKYNIIFFILIFFYNI